MASKWLALTWIACTITGIGCSGGCKHIYSDGEYCKSNFTIAGMINLRMGNDSKFFEKIQVLMRWEAFKFAVKEANEMLRKSFPELSIGHVLYDSCESEVTATRIATAIILGEAYTSCINKTLTNCPCLPSTTNKIVGVVGAEYSSHSKMTANILSVEGIPMISFMSTSVRLSDKEAFPYFLRTIAPDNYHTEAITEFILHHGWTYVSLITVDDEYGEMGKREFEERFSKKNICFYQNSVMKLYPNDTEVDDFLVKLNDSKTGSVVILFAYVYMAQRIFKRASALGVLNVTWIASEAIGVSEDFLQYDMDVIDGLILIQPYGGYYEEFEKYFWEKLMSNKSDNVWGKEPHKKFKMQYRDGWVDKREGLILESVPLVRNAVITFASALCKYITKTKKTSFESVSERKLFVNQYLIKTSFSNANTNQTIAFDKNGDILNQEILFIAATRKGNRVIFQKASAWSPVTGIQMLADIVWDGYHQVPPTAHCSEICKAGFYTIIDPRRTCCWECLPCPEKQHSSSDGQVRCYECSKGFVPNLNKTQCVKVKMVYLKYDSLIGNGIIIMASFGTFISLVICAILTCYKQTQIVKSSQFLLSIVQLVSHLLLFLTLLLYLVEPTGRICIVISSFKGALSTFHLSMLFLKAELILRLFEMRSRVQRSQLIIGYTVMITTITVTELVQILIVTLSYSLQNTSLRSIMKGNTHTVSCNHDTVNLLQVLYNIIISLLCGLQAMRSRNVPEYYLDSTSMSTASFASSAFYLIWIPLYFSFSGVQEKILVTATTTFLANISIVLPIYGWRIYIVLFRRKVGNKKASVVTFSN